MIPPDRPHDDRGARESPATRGFGDRIRISGDLRLPEYANLRTALAPPAAAWSARTRTSLRFEASRASANFSPGVPEILLPSERTSPQFFTSKRRTADHDPGAPEGSFALTRHHMVVVGSVLVVNCETATVWLRVSGTVKELESSISSV